MMNHKTSLSNYSWRNGLRLQAPCWAALCYPPEALPPGKAFSIFKWNGGRKLSKASPPCPETCLSSHFQGRREGIPPPSLHWEAGGRGKKLSEVYFTA